MKFDFISSAGLWFRMMFVFHDFVIKFYKFVALTAKFTFRCSYMVQCCTV